MSNLLFLITARAGSKGVPGKNLKKIGGLSLIGWKAMAARRAIHELSSWNKCRLVISTDCPHMQQEARRHGVEVPFTRPGELAEDKATSESVVRHALETLAGSYDVVVLLEPSAPFATSQHLVRAYRVFNDRNASLVVGMKTTSPNTHFIFDRRDDDNIGGLFMRMKYPPPMKSKLEGDRLVPDLSRQAFEAQWTMNGALYIFNSKVVSDPLNTIYTGAFDVGPGYGFHMDQWHSIEIDTPADLELAQYAIDTGHVKLPQPISISEKFLRKLNDFEL